MNRVNFVKKMPKRSGNYLVKDEKHGDVYIVQLYYCPETRDWWTFDYPSASGSQPYEDGDIEWWGPKVD